MALALDDLNEALSGDLDQPLRIGIGLHAGPAIVGEMGYERAASAHRDRRHGQYRQPAGVADQGIRASSWWFHRSCWTAPASISRPTPRHEVEIRGRQGRLAVRAIMQARDLTALS